MPRPSTTRHRWVIAGSGRDRGDSLVEVVVAIGLLGLVASAIVPAMWTSVRVSRVGDEQAQVEAVLGNAVDRIAKAGWMACPETASNGYEARAKAAASLFGWPATTVKVTDVKYWDPVVGSWTDTNPVPSTDCSKTAVSITKASTLQRVSVQASNPRGTKINRVDFVIGDIRTPDV